MKWQVCNLPGLAKINYFLKTKLASAKPVINWQTGIILSFRYAQTKNNSEAQLHLIVS